MEGDRWYAASQSLCQLYITHEETVAQGVFCYAVWCEKNLELICPTKHKLYTLPSVIGLRALAARIDLTQSHTV